MANCKDCVHNDMCYITHIDISAACSEFLDKNKYVEVVRCKERGRMRQSRARRERRERLQLYENRLRIWEQSKPAWWRIFARMKWKASKPQYVRR